MSEGDPTDHALAAIARILDKPETSDEPEATNPPESEASDQPELRLAEEILTATPSAPPPPTVPAAVEVEPEPEDIEAADTESADTVSNDTVVNDTENGIYTKLGPGPLAAIRFKWTARCDDSGDYFVDETIGENSHPIVSGPMTKEAAIRFVDDREHQARQRFEALRSEMAGGEIGRSVDQAS